MKENIVKIWSTRDVIMISAIFLGLLIALFLVLTSLQLGLAYKSLIINIGTFIFVMVPFIFFLKKKKISWEEFGFDEVKIKWVALSIILAFAVIYIGGFLSKEWSALIGLSSASDFALMDNIISNKIWLDVLNLKVGAVLLVPFVEELFFRGLIFRYIRQEKSFLFSAVLSSALFTLMHFSPSSLPFTLLLGLTTAFAYEKSGSMFYPFFIHVGVNSLAVNFLLLSSYGN